MSKKKVLPIIGNVVLWVFVVCAALFTVSVLISTGSGVPNVFGKAPIAIQSKSMETYINEGDLIVIDMLSEEQKSQLKVGDVIVFKVDLNNDNKEELNAHRIESITVQDNGSVICKTKGDNNSVADTYDVTGQKIVGKFREGGFKVGTVGYVITFLRTSTGFLVCIVIPLVLFFLFELYRFISVVVKAKGSKLTADEQEEIKRQAVAEYLAKQEAEKAGKDTESTEGTGSEQ